MTLVYIDDGDDRWMVDYEACDNLQREIMEQLTQRDREARTSQAFASLSANIRIKLNHYSQQVQDLRYKINQARRDQLITGGEAERRMRQVEILQSKDLQMRRLYESKTNELALSRARLLGPSTSAFADGGTTSWGLDDDNDQTQLLNSQPTSVADLKSQKQQLLRQQEEGLDELSKIISRQKLIAQAINSEVTDHNEIIDDLADHIDRTDERLIDGTRAVRTVSQKDKVCGYWVIIILLFAAIVTVALV
ncbi:syntaxin-8 [Trichogramma pretiosum]|uniref:syntaxin-8 n=1 Tax=Trichogramma pretiosum TaxID=7493 RepID=UPI0006C9685C|nr:syntaxin-8 [Trichogramma pretiosum]